MSIIKGEAKMDKILKPSKKLEIRDRLFTYSLYELESSNIKAPEDLWNLIIKPTSVQYDHYAIDTERTWEDEYHIIIYGIRTETDEEYCDRLNKERKLRVLKREKNKKEEQEKLEKEKALYEELKKKYG